MIAYRLAEFGVERMESGSTTFIHSDPAHPAWREYLAWRNSGNHPDPAPPHPFYAEKTPRNRLWIIGAGGYGREIFSMTSSARGFESEWHVAGFLNDVPDALDQFPDLPRIQGDTNYQPREHDLFVCAIGDISGRREVTSKFKSRGARFANLIQNTACVSPSATMGEGVIIEPFSGIGASAHIGNFASILGHVIISHDVSIGDYAQVAPFACVLGRASVGPGAFIATHAVVLPGVKIGAGATVGAGSVVVHDVLDGSTVFGVPAKRIN